jgi:hypothetical protein
MFTTSYTNAKPRKVNAKRGDLQPLRDCLIGNDPFDAGTMTGRTDVDPSEMRGQIGQLSVTDEALFRFATAPHRFVVFSYATPIGWVTAEGEIVIPDTRYSVTTSCQQTKVRAWLRAR